MGINKMIDEHPKTDEVFDYIDKLYVNGEVDLMLDVTVKLREKFNISPFIAHSFYLVWIKTRLKEFSSKVYDIPYHEKEVRSISERK
jgi:hypothetical protein|tara:strand:- start:479 stop:739 length:261 start_codon:yes stop_codon:yes gene_type:complete